MSDAGLPSRAATVGCGVIGAAWASRMLLKGVDVMVSDPSPDAERILDQVLSNAVTAWDDLGLPTDQQGTRTMAGSIAEAVADVPRIDAHAVKLWAMIGRGDGGMKQLLERRRERLGYFWVHQSA